MRLYGDTLAITRKQERSGEAVDQIDASVNQPLVMLASTKHARGRAGGGIRVWKLSPVSG